MRKLAFWLTVAFLFTVPWEDAISIESVGRISRVVGLLALAVWAVSVVLRRRIRRATPFVMAYFIFLIWSGLTLFWSVNPGATVGGFVTYIQIFGMILILWDLFETERSIEVALQAFVLGAYVASISLLVNWVNAPPTKFPQYQRINALGFETDGIALVVALAMPAAWYLAVRPHDSRGAPALRLVNIAYVPIAIFSIILTGTRGAALATIPTVIFILWSLRTSRRSQRLLAVIVVGVAVAAVWFAPPEPLERITGTASDIAGGDSLSGRRDIWAAGIDTFFANPIAGVGLDAFREASPFNKEAHNTPLSVLVETGLVGAMLFGYLTLLVLAATLRPAGLAKWYWRTQIAVVALGSMSLSLENSKPPWIFLTLAVASAYSVGLADAGEGREPADVLTTARQSFRDGEPPLMES